MRMLIAGLTLGALLGPVSAALAAEDSGLHDFPPAEEISAASVQPGGEAVAGSALVTPFMRDDNIEVQSDQ